MTSEDRLLQSDDGSKAQPARWYAGQRVRHTGNLEVGTVAVAAVDFAEALVGVEIPEADRIVWWRMENVIEVHPVGGAR